MKNGPALRAWFPAIVVLSLSWLPACGSDSESTTTSPTAVATLATDTFSGSIQQNGTAVHSFTVTSAGYSLLAGYTSISPSTVAALGLGIGSWDSSTSSCSLNVSQERYGAERKYRVERDAE